MVKKRKKAYNKRLKHRALCALDSRSKLCLFSWLLNVMEVEMCKLHKMKLLLTIVIVASGCGQALNRAGAEYLKISLKDTCGKEDKACIAAVDKQFDSCHRLYKENWDKYMDSSSQKDGQLMEVYSIKMYACIVDEKSEPYFNYNPG
jgi:hypothetical protein